MIDYYKKERKENMYFLTGSTESSVRVLFLWKIEASRIRLAREADVMTSFIKNSQSEMFLS